MTKAAKATTSKKRPKPESDEENSDIDMDSLHDASLLSNTPPSAKKLKKNPPGPKKSSGKPLQSIENESFAMDEDVPKEPKSKAKAPTNASEKYQKISHIEHILIRPDTYIGSVERTEKEMWVYNSESDAMEYREVSFVPGLYKIFDEVLVNAADNKQNDKNMDEIKVTVDRESGEISVWNNGKGIPIEIHAVSKLRSQDSILGSHPYLGSWHLHPRDDFRTAFDLL